VAVATVAAAASRVEPRAATEGKSGVSAMREKQIRAREREREREDSSISLSLSLSVSL